MPEVHNFLPSYELTNDCAICGEHRDEGVHDPINKENKMQDDEQLIQEALDKFIEWANSFDEDLKIIREDFYGKWGKVELLNSFEWEDYYGYKQITFSASMGDEGGPSTLIAVFRRRWEDADGWDLDCIIQMFDTMWTLVFDSDKGLHTRPKEEVDEQMRYKELEDKYGENFGDALSTAREIFAGRDTPEDVRSFYLAVLFDMPLPHKGAADELIKFFQSKESLEAITQYSQVKS